MLIGSVLYSACILLTDLHMYTQLIRPYQVLLGTSMVLGTTGFFYLNRWPNTEHAIALYGMAVITMAGIHDILVYQNILFVRFAVIPLAEAAMVIFMLTQMLSLYLQNNRFSDGVIHLTQKGQNIAEKIYERYQFFTKRLMDS